MAFLKIESPAGQVAAHLRAEILRGILYGEMPGVLRLEAELGVNRTTIEAALNLLEKEGLLQPQGAGRRRLISVCPDAVIRPALRIKMLLYDAWNRHDDYALQIRSALNDAGYIASFVPKTLKDLRMDPAKVARLVGETEADAWVVVAGPRPVLEWFAAQPLPAFAVFGHTFGLALACTGPDKTPAYTEAVRRLVELGHKRIVLLAQEGRRKPNPGQTERRFLDELESQGIRTGPYNLPDWEDSAEGLQKCLNSLFMNTPPTALVIQTAMVFHAARYHLASRGILAPQHVSLICSENSSTFSWCRPRISHFHFSLEPWVRRILRWADNVSHGIDDRRRITSKSVFVEGGSIGPATKPRLCE